MIHVFRKWPLNPSIPRRGAIVAQTMRKVHSRAIARREPRQLEGPHQHLARARQLDLQKISVTEAKNAACRCCTRSGGDTHCLPTPSETLSGMAWCEEANRSAVGGPLD